MTDIVERLRNGQGIGINLTLCRKAAAEIERLRAQNAKLRSFSLKALTVVEWAAGEGAVMEHPVYDADDLLLEGCDLLGVECAADARAALEEK